jgi:hypothetical protein
MVVKNAFSRLSLNVTGPKAKLEMHKFCLRPCLSQSLFFPNSYPTRRPPSPNSSLSHTPTPDFVQSSPPLPVSHSPSLPEDPASLPLFPFPFPQQIHKSLPPPIRSVIGEKKVRIDSQSQALFFSV